MKYFLCLFVLTVSSSSFGQNKIDNDIVQAVLKGQLKIVSLLLENGANVNSQNSQSKTLLYLATERNDLSMVDLLLDKNVLIDYPFGQNNKEKEKTVQKLIDPTPFLYAAAHGQADIIERLIQGNPDLNIRNYYGGNALIPAAEKGHYNTAKIILEKTDIDVDFINYLGWTALLEVVILSKNSEMQLKMSQLLLSHGAKVTITDNDGVNALEHAKNSKNQALISLLKKHL